MKESIIEIERFWDFKFQIIGKLKVRALDSTVDFHCKTLELPWRRNKSNISCIPYGEYRYTKYKSPSKGQVLLLHNVPYRSYIEIHAGNFYTETEGCILVGDDVLADINKDKLFDLGNSKETLKKLIDFVTPSGLVVISNELDSF